MNFSNELIYFFKGALGEGFDNFVDLIDVEMERNVIGCWHIGEMLSIQGGCLSSRRRCLAEEPFLSFVS